MVWERIRELEEEERREKLQRETQAQAESVRLEREAADRQAEENRRRDEERAREYRIIKEVLNKSGLLEGMRDIESGLDGLVRKHTIVLRPEDGTVKLVWGNKFNVRDDGEISYEGVWLSRYGQMDYSYIEARINTNTESVQIGYDRVAKDQWQSSPATIIDLLAKAYRNPNRVNARETPPSKYTSGSGSSSTPECCNS